MDMLDGERGSGASLLPGRCQHVSAAQAVPRSDRWPILRESRLPCFLATDLGSLLQVEGCRGLFQVFVPAFSLWLPFKRENYLKNESSKLFLSLAWRPMEKRELLSLSAD